MLSKQEVFDTVLNGIRGQGGFAREDGECLYRAPHGCKCAAGWLIPDEKYDLMMEGYLITGIPKYATRDEPVASMLGIDPHDIDFLEELQDCHDHAETMMRWENRMHGIAIEHDLKYQKPSEPQHTDPDAPQPY